ncbi:hypothetical protein NE237_000001 [Protea cynaroides]|uniref:Uncharacterized protein n=1 Tax=Protea cynaroides TaxID=273540 RepID=A0A9Q0JTB5_9MAGN|nr:hypothetical protein NE237_000001 [Protea cynaroides]
MEKEFMVSTISNMRININNPCHRPMKHGRDEITCNPRFKGVGLQPNGHWGAQIYANHHRIWLGTFKSEKEAAMAYDSAATKLRKGDSHRNLPLTEITIQEPSFQVLDSTEAILHMIRDGCYQLKFMDFLMNQSLNYGFRGTNQSQSTEEGIFYHELFHKELTPSDVGKLNRLVIPKQNAVKYFSLVPEVSTGGVQHGGQVEAMQIAFYDKHFTLWNFRYCYWKSSQSFVLTKGWSRFVSEKDLKAKDTIVFYRVEYRGKSEDRVRSIYMIDVKANTEEITEGSYMETEAETASPHCGGKAAYILPSSDPVIAGTSSAGTPVFMEEGGKKGEETKKGIRIFGVNINV